MAKLDTIAAFVPLSVAEKAQCNELKAREAQRLAPESARARAAFIERQSKHLAERTSMTEQAAARVVSRQCDGILLPDVVLPFDDPELGACPNIKQILLAKDERVRFQLAA
jgi:hypothetical protein